MPPDLRSLVELLWEHVDGLRGTGEESLEIVCRDGRYQRAYVRLGPINERDLSAEPDVRPGDGSAGRHDGGDRVHGEPPSPGDPA